MKTAAILALLLAACASESPSHPGDAGPDGVTGDWLCDLSPADAGAAPRCDDGANDPTSAAVALRWYTPDAGDGGPLLRMVAQERWAPPYTSPWVCDLVALETAGFLAGTLPAGCGAGSPGVHYTEIQMAKVGSKLEATFSLLDTTSATCVNISTGHCTTVPDAGF